MQKLVKIRTWSVFSGPIQNNISKFQLILSRYTQVNAQKPNVGRTDTQSWFRRSIGHCQKSSKIEFGPVKFLDQR